MPLLNDFGVVAHLENYQRRRAFLPGDEEIHNGWAFLHDYLEPFDAAVFTMEKFVPPDFPIARVEIMSE